MKQQWRDLVIIVGIATAGLVFGLFGIPTLIYFSHVYTAWFGSKGCVL